MGREPEKILNEFKERLSSFIGLKIELFKLNAYERVARIIAILSHSLILMLLALFAILFLFFTLAFFLGYLLNSTALGFLIVAGIYILLFIITYYSKKSIQIGIMNIVIGAIQEKEEDKDDGDDTKTTDNSTSGNTPSETPDSAAGTDRH